MAEPERRAMHSKRQSLIQGDGWQRLVVALLLGVLASYGLFTLATGLLASHGHNTADLMARAREFAVFRQGLYPIRRLMPPSVPASFPTSVYPPYAQVMFALFFGWNGAAGGWILVHGLSLLSLALISWIGWRSLRFAGPAAGLLGALAPIAIGGNSNCLFHGQFSMLCMGLISLQWLLLERQRPLPAGLCWALAMLKPQIAAAYALPLLQRGNRRGLLLGSALLLVLSLLALAYTQVSPLRYIAHWLQPGRLNFVRAGNLNLMGLLGPWIGGSLVLLALLVCARLLARRRRNARQSSHRQTRAQDPGATLRLQGLCAVLGALATYHLNYDNIMLFPAQLAILALALRQGGAWNRLLAVAMLISLWTPVHLTADRPIPQTLNAAVWLLVGLTLLLNGPGRFASQPPALEPRGGSD